MVKGDDLLNTDMWEFLHVGSFVTGNIENGQCYNNRTFMRWCGKDCVATLETIDMEKAMVLWEVTEIR